MRFIAVIIFSAMMQSAFGASAGERALAWAETQRNAALGSVMVARNRVEAAESDLTVSRNVEREIRGSKDADALSVAREAVTVSEQGVREAQALLKRAMAHLSKQENTLAAVQKFIAEHDSHKALVIPVEGKVRRVSPQSGTYSGDDISAPLRTGERVEVGPGSSARLFVSGGNAEVALSQNSSFTVTGNEADDSFEAMLSNGFGRLRTMTKSYFKKFEVRTPAAVVAVRGTDFSLRASPTLTRIEVFDGVVMARSIDGSKTVEVHAGEECEVLKDGGIQPVRPLDNQPRENPWSKDVSSN